MQGTNETTKQGKKQIIILFMLEMTRLLQTQTIAGLASQKPKGGGAVATEYSHNVNYIPCKDLSLSTKSSAVVSLFSYHFPL